MEARTFKLAKRAHQPAKKSRQYHHGDLRRELLRIARDEIACQGAESVSLSSIARLAGVSQPAPYRHFADRVSLLEGVAEEGFQEFSKVLIDAAAGRPSQEAVRAMALAYVDYGEANVELYRLMFASRLVPEAKRESALAKAADQAFTCLRRAMEEISPAETVNQDALLIWAQLHGLVMLRADGFISDSLGPLLNSSNLLTITRPRR